VLLCATTERPPTDSPTHLSPASVVFEFSNSYRWNWAETYIHAAAIYFL
jgi:hypothetical protein